MAIKTVDEVYQEIVTEGLFPSDLNLDPHSVRRLFLNNVFRRSLSLLTGLSDTGEIVLRATTTGELKVAPVGAGFTNLNSTTGTAPDAFNVTDQLDTGGSTRWDFLIEVNDAIIQLRNQFDTGWLDEVILPVGAYSIEISSTIVQIRNRAAGAVTAYQIVGYD